MNLVVLYGRLTRDPELRYSQNGMANTFATIAVDRGMSREKRQEAEAAGRPTNMAYQSNNQAQASNPSGFGPKSDDEGYYPIDNNDIPF